MIWSHFRKAWKTACHSGFTPKLLLVKPTLTSPYSLCPEADNLPQRSLLVSQCIDVISPAHQAWSLSTFTRLSERSVSFKQSRQRLSQKSGFFLGSGIFLFSNAPARQVTSASLPILKGAWSDSREYHAILKSDRRVFVAWLWVHYYTWLYFGFLPY